MICTEEFFPKHKTQQTCLSDVCKVEHKRQQARAKKEREEYRARKEKLKGRPEYIKDVDASFSAFIRYRDKDKPCICCGLPLGTQDAVGGGYDAGHYIPRGHMATRWDEVNVNAQRKYCNRHKGGNYAGYREGLIARYGLAEVERLEAARRVIVNLSIPELKALDESFKKKLKELKQQERSAA